MQFFQTTVIPVDFEPSQQWKPIMLLAIKDVKLTVSRRQDSKLYCLSYTS